MPTRNQNFRIIVFLFVIYLLFKKLLLNDSNNAHQIARPTLSEFYPHNLVILQYIANCGP